MDLIGTAKAVAALLLEITGTGPTSFPLQLPNFSQTVILISLMISFVLAALCWRLSALAVSAKPTIGKALMLSGTD